MSKLTLEMIYSAVSTLDNRDPAEALTHDEVMGIEDCWKGKHTFVPNILDDGTVCVACKYCGTRHG